MTSQLEMLFPAPVAASSAQLTIWQTETSIALRFGFRTPVYSKTGKLCDWRLEHVVLSNCISLEDFGAPKSQAGMEYDANKLADLFRDGARVRLIKRLGLNERQAELVEFRSLSVARHFAGTRVEASSADWV